MKIRIINTFIYEVDMDSRAFKGYTLAQLRKDLREDGSLAIDTARDAYVPDSETVRIVEVKEAAGRMPLGTVVGRPLSAGARTVENA